MRVRWKAPSVWKLVTQAPPSRPCLPTLPSLSPIWLVEKMWPLSHPGCSLFPLLKCSDGNSFRARSPRSWQFLVLLEGVEESVGQEEPVGTLSLSETTLFPSDYGIFSKGTVSSVHSSSEINNRVGITRWGGAVLAVGSSPLKFSLGSGSFLISLPEHRCGLFRGVFPTSHPRSSLPPEFSFYVTDLVVAHPCFMNCPTSSRIKSSA